MGMKKNWIYRGPEKGIVIYSDIPLQELQETVCQEFWPFYSKAYKIHRYINGELDYIICRQFTIKYIICLEHNEFVPHIGDLYVETKTRTLIKEIDLNEAYHLSMLSKDKKRYLYHYRRMEQYKQWGY